MNKRNEQGQQHGPWEEYYQNGKVHGLKEIMLTVDNMAHGKSITRIVILW